MPLINVWFYEPGPGDKWLNTLVNTYDPPYSHCDVQFVDDRMASSVFQYEKVYWKQRKFSRPGYKKITVSVNDQPYNKAYSMCAERAKQGFDFDAIGMYLLPASHIIPINRDKKTFCSKHCTEVLQMAELRAVNGVFANEVTPSALYTLLASSAVIHAESSPLSGLRIEAPAK